MRNFVVFIRNNTAVTFFLLSMLVSSTAVAQEQNSAWKFEQLKEALPTPNSYRTASGAPGHAYWQQQADYNIALELDDENQRISGSETITYHNNSPDILTYLWLQLDQNVRAPDADKNKVTTSQIDEKLSFGAMKRLQNDFDGGFKIEYVHDAANRPLRYTINKTMMRVDLKTALRPGGKVAFKVKWWYNINNRLKLGGRSGYEYFEADDNYLYTIAQFFPRMTVYDEVEGWQHKQFLGRGEFTVPFGDYRVSITVPADHVVTATGTLQNPGTVLTGKQRQLLKRARSASEPVIIIDEATARDNESSRATGKKTWIFAAKNVRDFAFASSRKFIWDAIGVPMGGRTVMAMSFYPKEGNPLWEQYSTKVVAHTLRSYSKYTFDYPYPVAISVHSDRIGMEYPMISFNGRRPRPDGTYSKQTKYRMIGVIIHEVGHNYFPMIVNSDERQWTWMDEGLNSFVQFLAEKEWEHDYPSRRGYTEKIVDYMKGDKSRIRPIMTNSEAIFQFGNNAYAKPAAALNILRETILGRDLFDFAFREYSRRWMFKHPTPADFFRTMEDASGVDLDWFWRGWFYGTDHVDLAIESVKWFKVDSKNPEVEMPISKREHQERTRNITDLRNQEAIVETMIEADSSLVDFYNLHDPYQISVLDEESYTKFVKGLKEDERALLDSQLNYYQVTFTNPGGLVMPLILELQFSDGTTEIERIPAEIWRKNDQRISKIFALEKELDQVTLDPFLETADVDLDNNTWPPRIQPTRFQLFKDKRFEPKENPMQREQRAREREQEIQAEKMEEMQEAEGEAENQGSKSGEDEGSK